MDTMPRDILHVTPMRKPAPRVWLPHRAFGWNGVVVAALLTLAITLFIREKFDIGWLYATIPGLAIGWAFARMIAHCRDATLDYDHPQLRVYREQEIGAHDKFAKYSISADDRLRRYERYRFSNGADRFAVVMLYGLVPFLCFHFLISLLA